MSAPPQSPHAWSPLPATDPRSRLVPCFPSPDAVPGLMRPDSGVLQLHAYAPASVVLSRGAVGGVRCQPPAEDLDWRAFMQSTWDHCVRVTHQVHGAGFRPPPWMAMDAMCCAVGLDTVAGRTRFVSILRAVHAAGAGEADRAARLYLNDRPAALRTTPIDWVLSDNACADMHWAHGPHPFSAYVPLGFLLRCLIPGAPADDYSTDWHLASDGAALVWRSARTGTVTHLAAVEMDRASLRAALDRAVRAYTDPKAERGEVVALWAAYASNGPAGVHRAHRDTASLVRLFIRDAVATHACAPPGARTRAALSRVDARVAIVRALAVYTAFHAAVRQTFLGGACGPQRSMRDTYLHAAIARGAVKDPGPLRSGPPRGRPAPIRVTQQQQQQQQRDASAPQTPSVADFDVSPVETAGTLDSVSTLSFDLPRTPRATKASVVDTPANGAAVPPPARPTSPHAPADEADDSDDEDYSDMPKLVIDVSGILAQAVPSGDPRGIRTEADRLDAVRGALDDVVDGITAYIRPTCRDDACAEPARVARYNTSYTVLSTMWWSVHHEVNGDEVMNYIKQRRRGRRTRSYARKNVASIDKSVLIVGNWDSPLGLVWSGDRDLVDRVTTEVVRDLQDGYDEYQRSVNGGEAKPRRSGEVESIKGHVRRAVNLFRFVREFQEDLGLKLDVPTVESGFDPNRFYGEGDDGPDPKIASGVYRPGIQATRVATRTGVFVLPAEVLLTLTLLQQQDSELEKLWNDTMDAYIRRTGRRAVVVVVGEDRHMLGVKFQEANPNKEPEKQRGPQTSAPQEPAELRAAAEQARRRTADPPPPPQPPVQPEEKSKQQQQPVSKSRRLVRLVVVQHAPIRGQNWSMEPLTKPLRDALGAANVDVTEEPSASALLPVVHILVWLDASADRVDWVALGKWIWENRPVSSAASESAAAGMPLRARSELRWCAFRPQRGCDLSPRREGRWAQ